MDILDGQTVEVKGSASIPYVLKNTGGVYSCSCPAWRNQSKPIEQRTCKHLTGLRGEEAERERLAAAGDSSERPTGRPASTHRQAKPAEGVPPLLLAERWDGQDNLAGWWMSEKLDGVRAYWDGSRFISRLGHPFHAPTWFVEGLPDVPLDGELWGGRKRFQRTVSVVRRQDASSDWKEISYLVFDAPSLDAPFESRLKSISELLAAPGLAYARTHEHALCRGLEHLKAELARVESLGGEGLMLRKPGSRYVAGRSSTLLKVKSFLDSEARVIGHVMGAGRHQGRLGAVLVEMPDGRTFSVGTGFSDAEREDPPPVGSVISYRYQELSDGGIPRFPSYVGVREDVPWEAAPGAASDGGDGPALTLYGSGPLLPIRIEFGVDGAAREVEVARTSSAGGVRGSRESSGGVGWPRRFELVEGRSSKFWQVSVASNSFEVRFGRIGTEGQRQTKTFSTDHEAVIEAEKLIAEKLRKGYQEK